MENLKIAKKPNPRKVLVRRLGILVAMSIIWFFFLYFNSGKQAEVINIIQRGAPWYFFAITLAVGYLGALITGDEKKSSRVRTEIIIAFVLTVAAGATERITIGTDGMFSASTTFITYCLSKIIYLHFQKIYECKCNKESRKTMPNGPVMKIKKGPF